MAEATAATRSYPLSRVIKEGYYWCVLNKPIEESGFTVLQKTHMCARGCSGGSDIEKEALLAIGKMVMANQNLSEGVRYFLAHYGGDHRDKHHALFIGPCDECSRMSVYHSLHRANVINRSVLFHD